MLLLCLTSCASREAKPRQVITQTVSSAGAAIAGPGGSTITTTVTTPFVEPFDQALAAAARALFNLTNP